MIAWLFDRDADRVHNEEWLAAARRAWPMFPRTALVVRKRLEFLLRRFCEVMQSIPQHVQQSPLAEWPLEMKQELSDRLIWWEDFHTRLWLRRPESITNCCMSNSP